MLTTSNAQMKIIVFGTDPMLRNTMKFSTSKLGLGWNVLTRLIVVVFLSATAAHAQDTTLFERPPFQLPDGFEIEAVAAPPLSTAHLTDQQLTTQELRPRGTEGTARTKRTEKDLTSLTFGSFSCFFPQTLDAVAVRR